MTRFALLFLLFTCAAAQAQLRTIPQDAVWGQIRHVQAMIVEIDGTQRRLAQGAQIRDRSNRIMLPSAIPAGAWVKYQLDKDGFVQAVWFLTREEAKGQ